MDLSNGEESSLGRTEGKKNLMLDPPIALDQSSPLPLPSDANDDPKITTDSSGSSSQPHPYHAISQTDTAPGFYGKMKGSSSSHCQGSSLRVQTDISPHALNVPANGASVADASNRENAGCEPRVVTSGLPNRTSSTKATLSASPSVVGSLSPSSARSSPAFGPIVDITPLPSPLTSADSPGPWKRMVGRPDSRGGSVLPPTGNALSDGSYAVASSPQRRKAYSGLKGGGSEAFDSRRLAHEDDEAHHGQHRSISDYVPDSLQVPKQRNVTVATHRGSILPSVSPELQMKREKYLAIQRGLSEAGKPPTPPPSNQGADSSDSDSSYNVKSTSARSLLQIPGYNYVTANRIKDNERRSWRFLRILGQGTFSTVILATSQGMEESAYASNKLVTLGQSDSELDPKSLVAVKVVEHGPAGGASEERIEISLERELDILKSVHHPSLVHLKAFSVEDTRALLVLSYCPGGDLFDFATQKPELLVPDLIRRIFAELVAATRYLHEKWIVHRDIKLENVLLRVPWQRILEIKNWQTYPHAVVMLTDLGLSRRINKEDLKLETRCGSDDYAAPELRIGPPFQPYDGRQTDAWALGVLLYAIMEGRLPFDPVPGTSESQRTQFKKLRRIALCEWDWFKYTDDDGEPGDFGELAGARVVVEGLLVKSTTRRFSLDRVSQEEWVKGGVQVEGGIKIGDDTDGVSSRPD
ncbi:MAG: hypothetical protein M1837_006204 [Sclerophora amabilis]|nr:MAG: hypothetical protein M1837_006204 [Sclerophora amabilis]